MPADIPAARRPSRLRLYLPFALLALLVVGWSVAWLVIRNRAVAGMDEWLAAESASGRQWTCPDRSVAGYPFRIELGCESLALRRPDVTMALGRVTAVAQVYSPGHIIIEAKGPLRMVAEAATVDADWGLLQASVVLSSGAFERLAIAADGPKLRSVSAALGSVQLDARRVEIHARPDPADRTTVDLAVNAVAAIVPGLDALVGGSEAADLDVVLRVTRVADLPARPLPSELERWRMAGGEVEVARARMSKGARRVEAQGKVSIDEAHRPRGEVTGQVAGIEGLLGRFVGDKAGLAGNLLGALFGARPPDARRQTAPDANAPALNPLPPIRVENGRVFVGPLSIPALRVPPLY